LSPDFYSAWLLLVENSFTRTSHHITETVRQPTSLNELKQQLVRVSDTGCQSQYIQWHVHYCTSSNICCHYLTISKCAEEKLTFYHHSNTSVLGINLSLLIRTVLSLGHGAGGQVPEFCLVCLVFDIWES